MPFHVLRSLQIHFLVNFLYFWLNDRGYVGYDCEIILSSST